MRPQHARACGLVCRVVVILVCALASRALLAAPARADEESPPVYLPFALPGQQTAQRPTATPARVTATATPSLTSQPSPPPTETPTPELTATPTATEEPTPEGPEWLAYVNWHRALAGLGPVTENAEWSRGGELHARYMVKNNVIGHSENPGNPHYTREGHEAAANGNVFLMAATNVFGTHRDAIDSWMTGPFHMLPIIDPHLKVSGFGEHAESFDRWHRYGATLDVHRGRDELPPDTRFPVHYPLDGGRLPNLTYDGGEFPDPLVTCTGYRPPTGAPVALQLGTGDITPKVRRTAFRQGGTALAHCWFDETRYPTNPGRLTLDVRDAIIIMPRQPLVAGVTYTAEIELEDRTYTWSFVAGRDGTQAAAAITGLPGSPPRLDGLVRSLAIRRIR